jgi:hypothetical protein
MKDNERVTVEGKAVRLVPYTKRHVLKYGMALEHPPTRPSISLLFSLTSLAVPCLVEMQCTRERASEYTVHSARMWHQHVSICIFPPRHATVAMMRGGAPSATHRLVASITD